MDKSIKAASRAATSNDDGGSTKTGKRPAGVAGAAVSRPHLPAGPREDSARLSYHGSPAVHSNEGETSHSGRHTFANPYSTSIFNLGSAPSLFEDCGPGGTNNDSALAMQSTPAVVLQATPAAVLAGHAGRVAPAVVGSSGKGPPISRTKESTKTRGRLKHPAAESAAWQATNFPNPKAPRKDSDARGRTSTSEATDSSECVASAEDGVNGRSLPHLSTVDSKSGRGQPHLSTVDSKSGRGQPHFSTIDSKSGLGHHHPSTMDSGSGRGQPHFSTIDNGSGRGQPDLVTDKLIIRQPPAALSAGSAQSRFVPRQLTGMMKVAAKTAHESVKANSVKLGPVQKASLPKDIEQELRLASGQRVVDETTLAIRETIKQVIYCGNYRLATAHWVFARCIV